MAERPSQFPEFASDGTEATEPTGGDAGLKQTGWLPGNPERQYMNWIHWLTYYWLLWFDQTLPFFDLEYPEGPVPGGDAPATGAGLAVLAGHLSGRGVINGYAVKDTPAQAYTYIGSRDTYWDLSDAAVWTPVVVNNGAGEPAVTADSVRFYKVVTDATDRTSVVDRRPSTIRGLAKDFTGAVRLALADTWNGVAPSEAERRQAKLEIISGVDNLGGALYELLEVRSSDDGSLLAHRLYQRIDGGTFYVWVSGAVLTNASTGAWEAEAASARWEVIQDDQRSVYRLEGMSPGDPIADGQWQGTGIPLEKTESGFDITLDGVLDADDYAYAPMTHRHSGLRYTPIEQSVLATHGQERYLTQNLFDGGTGAIVQAFNARFNQDTDEWERIDAGDAFLEVTSAALGRVVYVNRSTGGASWADTATASTWRLVEGGRFAARAWCLVTTDGAGGATILQAAGINAATVPASNRVRFTLIDAFTNTNSFDGVANSRTTLQEWRIIPQSTTTFDLFVPQDPLAGGVAQIFFVVVWGV
jgi:hypothetical protein